MPTPITYDAVAFAQTLQEIRDYLSELRYIDQALEYLEEEKASWWHGVEPIGPGTTHVTVTLGTTLPFTRRYEIPGRDSFLTFWKDSKQDEVNKQLQALATEAEEWATAELESFRPASGRSPGCGQGRGRAG